MVLLLGTQGHSQQHQVKTGTMVRLYLALIQAGTTLQVRLPCKVAQVLQPGVGTAGTKAQPHQPAKEKRGWPGTGRVVLHLLLCQQWWLGREPLVK